MKKLAITHKIGLRLKTKKSRIIMVFTTMAILLSSLSLGIVANAINTTKSKSDDPSWLIQSYIYYDLMEVCLRTSNLNNASGFNKVIKPKHFSTGEWFENSSVIDTGAYFSPDGSTYKKSKQGVGCSNKHWVLNAASHWGVSLEELAIMSGLEKTGDNWDHVTNEKGSAKEFKKNYKEKIAGGGDILYIGTNGEYLFWQKSFNNLGLLPNMTLGNGPGDKPPVVGGDTMKVKWVDLTTCEIKEGYYTDQQFISGYDTYMESFGRVSQHLFGDYKPGIGPSNIKLSDAVTRYNKVAVDYQKNCEKMKEADPDLDPSKPLPVTFTNEPPMATDEATTQSSCNIKTIGWIICPVVNFMADIADKAYTFIEKDFLIIDSKLLNKPEVKDTWVKVQGLANIAFIIAFLIIIFSQVTSLGISNFGIKKMLPKLIIAAILVNLSFIICQLAIDLSNTVGASVNSFIKNSVSDSTIDYSYAGMPSATGEGMAGIAGKVLVGSLAVGAFLLSLSALIPILIGAIIACIMILFILVGRKALVIILTILSPLAFVAYMLPNTKSLFDKWQKAFTSMLLVYPIVALVFAGSKLAASILMPEVPDDPGDAKMMEQIIASGVAVLPLFVIPGLLKKSMDGIAGVGNIVSKMSSGASAAGKKGTIGAQKKYGDSNYGKFRTANRVDRKDRIRAGTYQGKGGKFNPRNLRSSAHKGLNDSERFNKLTGGYGGQSVFDANKKAKEDSKDFNEMVGDNEPLMGALGQGAFEGEGNSAYDKLTDENKNTIMKMKTMGLDRKASTYLALSEHHSANGIGDGTESDAAIQKAGQYGASESSMLAAYETAKSGYKKSGHAKGLTNITNAGNKYNRSIDTEFERLNPPSSDMTLAKGFTKITPKDLSKFNFTDPNDPDIPDARIRLGQEQRAFSESLTKKQTVNGVTTEVADADRVNTTLNQFSEMNGDTQKAISNQLTAAAQRLAVEQANSKGIDTRTIPAFQDPADARAYFQSARMAPPPGGNNTGGTSPNHHYN